MSRRRACRYPRVSRTATIELRQGDSHARSDRDLAAEPRQRQRDGHHEVTFPELVRAHHLWETSTDAATGEARLTRFKQLLDDFQHQSGQVIDAYWCHKEASAVALTRREMTKRGRFGRKRKIEYRLHRVSDWVTGENHEIADLLHDSDILGLKAAASLEGVPRAVVMQWLLLVDSHLLGFLERYRHEPCHPAVAELFAENERAELRRIEDYYFRAGEKRARMRYVPGMVTFGVVLVAAAGGRDRARALALRRARPHSTAVQEFYAAAAAGGVGAVVSVLMRMSGRGSFAIDHELSRWEVMLVGAYRPLIGSVSGIVVYFLVQTPLIPIEQSGADAAVLRRGRVPRGLQRAVDEGGALRRDAHDRRARAAPERAGAAAHVDRFGRRRRS